MTAQQITALLPFLVLTATIVVVMLAISVRRHHRVTAFLSVVGLNLTLLSLLPTWLADAVATVAIPEIRPPPPIGTISVSMSGASSSISSATVPCPAMMSGSSKGWTKVGPSSTSSLPLRRGSDSALSMFFSTAPICFGSSLLS